MWENINCCLLAAEIVLLIVGVFYLIGKKTVIRTFLYVGLVFLMTLTVYVVPLYYADFTAEKGVEILVGFFTGIGHTVKQFMGESETEKVYSYAEEFPLYSWVFSLSAVMAIVTTGYATVSIFRRRFFNDIARAGRLKKDYCDIFVGCGEKAVSYAKRSKNVVLLVDEATEKESVVALVDDGCVVMRGKLSPKFLKSRWFKKTKRYNIILSGETENLHIDLATVLQCVSAVYKIKNIHFYLEIDERVAEIVQQQIDAKQKADNVSYREYITLFSLNELVARKFVEENPSFSMLKDLISISEDDPDLTSKAKTLESKTKDMLDLFSDNGLNPIEFFLSMLDSSEDSEKIKKLIGLTSKFSVESYEEDPTIIYDFLEELEDSFNIDFGFKPEEES